MSYEFVLCETKVLFLPSQNHAPNVKIPVLHFQCKDCPEPIDGRKYCFKLIARMCVYVYVHVRVDLVCAGIYLYDSQEQPGVNSVMLHSSFYNGCICSCVVRIWGIEMVLFLFPQKQEHTHLMLKAKLN